jgi:Cu+-exporting ATPase
MNMLRYLKILAMVALVLAVGCSEEPAQPAGVGVDSQRAGTANPAEPQPVETDQVDAGQAPGPADDRIRRTFAVEGMHCDGCVQAITAKLTAMPGVDSVEVSLADESATVICQADGPDPDQVVKAVEGLGYQAELTGR